MLLLLHVKSALPVVVCIVIIVRLIRVMTLLMHHLPGGLQSPVRYLLLCVKLLGLAHRCLLLLLHFQHLLLVLQIHCRTLHLQCIKRVKIAATAWSRRRAHVHPRITLRHAKSWNVLHQIMLLHVLLRENLVRLGYTAEPVALVQRDWIDFDSLMSLLCRTVSVVVLRVHELTEVERLCCTIGSSAATARGDGRDGRVARQ